MHPYTAARAAAEHLVAELAPYCGRIEIAGSIRRGSQVVKDIEIVAQGMVSQEPVPGKLFTETRPFDHLEHRLADITENRHRSIHRPRQKEGDHAPAPPWGPRYKRLWVTHERVTYAVDLFQPTAETWGPTLVLRTGPADFSRLLVTSQDQGGAMPRKMRQHEGRLEQATSYMTIQGHEQVSRLLWKPVETPDEASYFAALGVPCWTPHERTEARLAAWLAEQGITPPARTRSGDKAPYAPYGAAARPAQRSHYRRR